ncbi:amino acid adenylation domain-containing protein [Streptomyces sp. NPDC051136]|uniref:amino acid adenylation domain-containing protein n=1 Tax=Streptomyces sp. NPDC051136 TaxID=3365643 RepID=UPI00379CE6E4
MPGKDAPSGVPELLARIDALPPRRRAQLWQRLWERGVSLSALMRQGEDEASAPASFTQRRMVFLHEFDPLSPAYNCPAPLRLRGRVSPEAVEGALNDILRRHDALRTRLPVRDGDPVQLVAPPRHQELPVIDLTGLSERERERESDRLVRAEQAEPFDLAQGPLVRFRLVRMADDDALLLLTFHHAVVDGWSYSVISRELDAFYGARLAGRPSPLPAPRLQYADYARWQRDWLESEEAERQLDYWTTRLAGAPESLALTTDRPRTANSTRHGAVHQFLLLPALGKAVDALAGDTGCTPFMVLLAALQTVLARMTGQDDIVVGTPVANRRYKEFHDLVGFFVNSVALRARPRAELTFEEFLAEVRTTCLDAYEHQDIPLDVIAQRVFPDREVGRNPIYQVNLALHNTPPPQETVAGVSLQPLDLDHEGARFDLDLVVQETDAGLECRLIYAADLFDEPTVVRIADGFVTLLTAALADRTVRLEDLPIMTAAESARAVAAGTGPRLERPEPLCVHRLFEERARQTPDAPAVSAAGRDTLTYRELDGRANAFAHHLRDLGVRHGSVVALLLNRTPDAVAAFLGVLKAGAAYVPLDPAYPSARLEHMLADSGAQLLVAESSTTERVDGGGLTTTLLEQVPWTSSCGTPPEVASHEDDLMYLMYTSGSTGRPKGAMLAHRQVVNYLLWAAETYRAAEGDGVPVHSSLSFDLTVTSVFAPLLAGQQLVVHGSREGTDGGVPAYADHEGTLSFVKLTPSHLRLLEAHGVDQRPGVWANALVIGGEALYEEQLARWRDGGTRLINEYGPTEAAVACAFHESDGTAERGPVPIGRPITNVSVHVLDRSMRPVPPGVTGELFIGGQGVSYGYLGRAAQTADRFVPDPYATVPGARLYRTGDLAVRRDDGSLVYLGRGDEQVKIRGHRVEPGEVEAALTAHPQVRQGVVVADADRLVAFLRADPEDTVPAGPDRAADADRVAQWRLLYDNTYGADEGPETLTGWDSSYTGQAIEAEQMHAWLDDTVARIEELRPRRALEIGCGTGMILGRVAPGCEHYRGTDLSPVVVEHLRRDARAAASGTVELFAAPAHRAVRDGDTFDTVILNSVVQYFPSVTYLLRVLDTALAAVRDGGHVFIGDVRNLDLLELFQTSVAVYQAAAGTRAGDVRARVRHMVESDEELCLSPGFFRELGRHRPQISGVRIMPKRGRHRNELTCYRYDVVLTVGGPATPEPRWLGADHAGADRLAKLLEDERPDSVGLRSLPNARLQYDLSLRRLLRDAPAGLPVAEVRIRSAAATEPGHDPEDYAALGDRGPYEVELGWADGGDDGTFDVVVRRRDALPGPATTHTAQQPELGAPRWAEYANDPLWREACATALPGIETHLRQRLPEHMVPSRFLFVRDIPLTPNGKVDTASLRFLMHAQGERGVRARSGRRPLTPTERKIAAMWRELLSWDDITADDDFFTLGGHSLLTFQLVLRLRAEFGVDVPTGLPFETPGLAAMAERMDDLCAGDAGTGGTPRLVSNPRKPLMPTSSAQERLWFLHQLDPGSHSYNVPIFFRLSGRLSVPAFHKALDGVVRRHEVLRTLLVSQDGRPFQEILPHRPLDLPVLDLTGLPGETSQEEVTRLAAAEYARPFDLARETALRAALLRVAEDEHVLLLSSHHIAFDGWSGGLLLSEVVQLYTAALDGRPAEPLPPLEVQYADYALWERRMADEGHFDRLDAYWVRQLEGVADLPGIPLDRPRPARPAQRSESLGFRLPASVAEPLRARCREQDATLFMGLLAGVYAVLHRHSGATDVVVGTDVAGRTDVGTERLIGFFVNQVVLRADLSGTPDWPELVRRVRTLALEAYAHQELPFDRVVRQVNPRRGRNRSPLFQVKVTLNNTPQEHTTMRGVELTPLPLAHGGARSDVAVELSEEPDGAVSGVWEYDTEIFEAATMRRLLDCYLSLLRTLADQVPGPVADLPLPGEEQ